MFFIFKLAGIKKKVPLTCPRQVDFSVGQVTFHAHLHDERGPRQVVCQLNKKINKYTKTCPGEAKFDSGFSEGQDRTQVLPSPETASSYSDYTI